MARAAEYWSSLPSELVSRVADVFLATSDIDYYANLRAVCHNWRAATDDPRGPDPRFRPHRWVMLDELDRNAGVSRLFLNLETGRFLRRDLPAFRYHLYVASADGLLVLLASNSETRLRVLNPITGSVVRFHASTVQVHPRDAGVAVAGSSPMVLTIFSSPSHGACFEPSVPGVNPSSPPVYFTALDGVTSVVAFQGRVYAADRAGSVAVLEYTGPDTTPEITVLVAGERRPNAHTFLVDSAGEELLLVRASPTTSTGRSIQVFRVDLANNALEPAMSIENRALVLGVQSVSVDARHVLGFEGNRVYYGNGMFGQRRICVYRVDDGSEEVLAAHPTDEERRRGEGRVFPMPLPQLLVISAWPFRDSDFEGI